MANGKRSAQMLTTGVQINHDHSHFESYNAARRRVISL